LGVFASFPFPSTSPYFPAYFLLLLSLINFVFSVLRTLHASRPLPSLPLHLGISGKRTLPCVRSAGSDEPLCLFHLVFLPRLVCFVFFSAWLSSILRSRSPNTKNKANRWWPPLERLKRARLAAPNGRGGLGHSFCRFFSFWSVVESAFRHFLLGETLSRFLRRYVCRSLCTAQVLLFALSSRSTLQRAPSQRCMQFDAHTSGRNTGQTQQDTSYK